MNPAKTRIDHSARRSAVVDGIACGLTGVQIAAKLGISASALYNWRSKSARDICLNGPRLGHRVEDAHELLDLGEAPDAVASRLGTTLPALEILCRRHGRPRKDLMTAAKTQRGKS